MRNSVSVMLRGILGIKTLAIFWLWDAACPDVSGQGVVDDEARARVAAEALIRSGVAFAARVEMALAHIGIRTPSAGYERLGQSWAARCFPREESGTGLVVLACRLRLPITGSAGHGVPANAPPS